MKRMVEGLGARNKEVRFEKNSLIYRGNNVAIWIG